jgi:hypothetical protein
MTLVEPRGTGPLSYSSDNIFHPTAVLRLCLHASAQKTEGRGGEEAGGQLLRLGQQPKGEGKRDRREK